MATSIVTVDEVLTHLGASDADDDLKAQIQQDIGAVTTMIGNFTGRDFGATEVTEARVFDYDWSGYLDIDDASDVTKVEIQLPHTDLPYEVESDYWMAMPLLRDDNPVHYYLILPSEPEIYSNVQRRFYGMISRPQRVVAMPARATVTATWGWPDVPADVKQAAFWCIDSWTTREDEDMTSESISGYARGWTRRQPSQALTKRAMDVLASYVKDYS